MESFKDIWDYLNSDEKELLSKPNSRRTKLDTNESYYQRNKEKIKLLYKIKTIRKRIEDDKPPIKPALTQEEKLAKYRLYQREYHREYNKKHPKEQSDKEKDRIRSLMAYYKKKLKQGNEVTPNNRNLSIFEKIKKSPIE